MTDSEKALRYQARKAARGICVVCTLPAVARRDGLTGTLCERHVELKRERKRRHSARVSTARAVRRGWLGGHHCCSVCGRPGHKKGTCSRGEVSHG